MADTVTPAQRSLNMSRIKARDTAPEMFIRRGLHARGLRYRLNVATLPGRPDMVFPAHRAVIFVHGCFWHRHDCAAFRWPSTRPAFWETKLNRNAERDDRDVAALRADGWRVLTVWECAIRRAQKAQPDKLIDRCARFVWGKTGSRSIA